MTSPPGRISRWKQYIAGGALVAAGVAGGSLIGNAVASADTVTGTATAATSSSDTTDPTEASTSAHQGETLLTGADADKVTAAALAQYPGATIGRVETDSDGVYEAHLTTTDGQKLTVQVDANFTVTGTETHTGHGGRGGSGETLLTGADADKVTAAALAQYPGATIDRVETDSDGVYEAHLTTTDGQKLTVQVDASFTVTGTETRGERGDH